MLRLLRLLPSRRLIGLAGSLRFAGPLRFAGEPWLGRGFELSRSLNFSGVLSPSRSLDLLLLLLLAHVIHILRWGNGFIDPGGGIHIIPQSGHPLCDELLQLGIIDMLGGLLKSLQVLLAVVNDGAEKGLIEFRAAQ